MNKLTSVLLISLLSANTVLASQEPTLAEIKKKNDAYVKSMGIELLDSEVKIVPAKSFMTSLGIKGANNDDFLIKTVSHFLAMHEEQLKNGYVKDENPRAKELQEFHHVSIYQYKKYKNEYYDQTSTHLRHSINDLKMGYTFLGVPATEMSFNIGVSPYGAYKQVKNGDDADGWDGAVQFFEKKEIGSCAFTEHNIKLAHSGTQLIQELVSYEINDKPSILLVKGNETDGFTYKISWYDNTFSRELECANSMYSADITKATLELAKRIDNA